MHFFSFSIFFAFVCKLAKTNLHIEYSLVNYWYNVVNFRLQLHKNAEPSIFVVDSAHTIHKDTATRKKKTKQTSAEPSTSHEREEYAMSFSEDELDIGNKTSDENDPDFNPIEFMESEENQQDCDWQV